MTTTWPAFLAVVLCAAPALGQFRLANIYGDQMVLQMAPKSTQIWGFGTAGTSVSVSVNAQQVSTTVNGKSMQ
ncbi:hypothetical protein B566_EDAN003625 [Ephemera danica]|nr:hypothetical protein B566_EDAN003625 [Ephemera danica]